MTAAEIQFPKLRAVDARPVIQGGRPSILLRDPLRLTDKAVVIPQVLAPLLTLCDGTRDSSALRAALAVRAALPIGPAALQQLLSQLDEALLLDNERFALARERALTEYRQAPFRPPILAGQSYPADPVQLRQLLQSYIDAVDDVSLHPVGGRGLVSPHIDLHRGGPIYARVWKCAAEAVKAADLVVLVGTDHIGGKGQLTLTRQHYATPFGVLPTAREIVDAVGEAVGEKIVFANELHHRSEHSIELAAVWLHHIREGQSCQLVPMLCGSFDDFVQGEAEPEQDPAMNALVRAVKQTMARGQALVVAAGDLSHVGPAFGGQPLGIVERARLQMADNELIELICAGDAEGFYERIKREKNRYNVCGLPPIYLALRMLSPVQGEQVAYHRCPADEKGTSLVSVCGILLK